MFKPQRILCPTDFSAHSDAAFALACSIARDTRADLLVLHVAPPPVSLGDVAESQRPGFRDDLRARLHQLRPDDPNLGVVHFLLEGDPAEVILDAAGRHEADLIVLGTHGRSGVGRLLLGSVAEQVLRRATCPVLTVKAPPAPARPDPTGERWATVGR